MRIPTDPDDLPLLTPAQVEACQRLSRDYATLCVWAERAAQQIQARVESGTASPTERALWRKWQRVVSTIPGRE